MIRLAQLSGSKYLTSYQWLSLRPEPTVNLDREMHKHQDVRLSVLQIVDRGHLANFLARNPELGNLLHFDPRTRVLAVEDPSFHFFLKNIRWARFAERVGYLNVGFNTSYDFALSFAGTDRKVAERISDVLTDREFSVFYDFKEQARMLAVDLEEYLAPIYASEASFVICLLGSEYPKRLWTKFESKHFRARFGAEAVIPIWMPSVEPSAFDDTGRVGGYFFQAGEPMAPQIDYLADLLQQKIAHYRLACPISPGQFRCRLCHLVLPIAVISPGFGAICEECAETRTLALARKQ